MRQNHLKELSLIPAHETPRRGREQYHHFDSNQSLHVEKLSMEHLNVTLNTKDFESIEEAACFNQSILRDNHTQSREAKRNMLFTAPFEHITSQGLHEITHSQTTQQKSKRTNPSPSKQVSKKSRSPKHRKIKPISMKTFYNPQAFKLDQIKAAAIAANQAHINFQQIQKTSALMCPFQFREYMGKPQMNVFEKSSSQSKLPKTNEAGHLQKS